MQSKSPVAAAMRFSIAPKQARVKGLTCKIRRDGLMIGGSNEVISLAELARPNWLDKWWSANNVQSQEEEIEQQPRERSSKRLNRMPPARKGDGAASTSGAQFVADLGANFQLTRCDSASSESSNAGKKTQPIGRNKRACKGTT